MRGNGQLQKRSVRNVVVRPGSGGSEIPKALAVNRDAREEVVNGDTEDAVT